jgi:hypothetical protein
MCGPVKGGRLVPMIGAAVRRGVGPGTDKESVPMKNKLFRLGVTVAMLAVLIESLGAPMKW